MRSGSAGTGQLEHQPRRSRTARRPTHRDLPRFAEQLHKRARIPLVETAKARERLATFDVPYFSGTRRQLLLSALHNPNEPPIWRDSSLTCGGRVTTSRDC